MWKSNKKNPIEIGKSILINATSEVIFRRIEGLEGF
jgi:hypothetical protein